MRIGAQTMESLKGAKRAEFESRVVDHLQRVYPYITFELSDEQVKSRVHAAVDRGKAHGLRSERDLVTYVDLSFELGDGFEQSLDWARAIFDDPSLDPAARMHRVRSLVYGIEG